MSIEQFTIQPPYSVIVTIFVAALITIGAFLIVISLSSKLLKAISSISYGHTLNLTNKYVYATLGIAVILFASVVYYFSYIPSTVTVGSGYVNVQFSGFSPSSPSTPFANGNKNVTSNEIASAFVGQIGSGDFTLTKQQGTDLGNTNIGVYKLGNGATAYVASTNSTDLIIQLNNGQYVILGTSNTNALATSFSQNVYPLKSP
jgi:hypothetical protein